MNLDILLLVLLIVQGVLGGIDTLLNHELIVRLPRHVEARTELGLHSMREAVYGILFGGLGWLAWHGAWVVLIVVLLVAQMAVDASDEFVENRTRTLPQNERVLHFFIVLNFGLIVAVLSILMIDWVSQPTSLKLAGHGTLSWILSVLAVAAFAWAVRDFFAWRRLGRNTA
ncbi:MAG TPA: hypothetical protein VJ654_13130 [Noviherbaspirillum sp.]|nr:hypothetical protein [Noviherbaspirillum sp.]